MRPERDPWIRRSPFYEATLRAGCRRYSVVDGVYYPISYRDPLEEYRALVSKVTLWDVPSENAIEVCGPQAAAFLDWAQTRDICRHPVSMCRYSLFTDAFGGVLFDTVILRTAPDRFLLSGSLDWLTGIALDRWNDVTIRRTDIFPLQLQGPRARGVMSRLAGNGVASLRFFALTAARIAGIPVIVTRTGWSGEQGFEIYLLDSGEAEPLWEAVLDAGEPDGLTVTASSEMRRIEAGILNAGTDLTPDLTPFEAGLGRLVDLKRNTRFVGRAALEAGAAASPTKRLVGILLEEDPEVSFEEPWPILHDHHRIGHGTAVVFSPALGQHIGYAVVPARFASGASLRLASPSREVAIRTVSLPFVDPDRARMRG